MRNWSGIVRVNVYRIGIQCGAGRTYLFTPVYHGAVQCKTILHVYMYMYMCSIRAIRIWVSLHGAVEFGSVLQGISIQSSLVGQNCVL